MSELFYPLRLEPYVKEVVWGGRWLADELGRVGPKDAPLGESWEAYSDSTVTNGPLAGRKLGQLFEEYGAKLVGSSAEAYPKFPLLVKFIDARENLSIQVHPNNALAQKLENSPFGKTEFWYIIQAGPEAAICYSLNDEATSREQLGQAIQNQDIVRFLQTSPVKAGDVVFIPAGTVHALTKGIVVYELQQDSDITYRLYDWGRTGREIHIEKGLQAVNLDYRNLPITHPAPVAAEGYERTRLVECEYFISEVWQISQAANFQATAKSFVLLTNLAGAGQITSPTQDFTPQALDKGDTVLIPAGLAYTLTNRDSTNQLEIITGWLV